VIYIESIFVTKEELNSKAQQLIINSEGPFSIAVADIDNFESINKIYGYSIGDEAIKKIGTVFSQNLKNTDIICRQGDEFNILLVGKGAERSFMDMEEIRRYFSDNTFNLNANNKSENVYITFSCGIGSYPRDAKNSVDLFRVADSALYRAKKLGKNKICLSEVESMVLKSNYFTKTQLDRLSQLSKEHEKTEASLLREALDDLFKKHSK